MPRRLANGLTLLSAVVCVGSAMVVGRSVFRLDTVVISTEQGDMYKGFTIDGQLVLSHDRFTGPTMYFTDTARARRRDMDHVWEDSWGVRWLGIGGSIVRTERFLILPLWLLPLLTAIAPVRWLLRRNIAGRGFPISGATESEGRAEGDVRVTK